MARYLRDELISNVTIDGDAITQIVTTIGQRGLVMPEYRPVQDDEAPTVYFYYTIRFDTKGYRVHSLDELLAHFDQAKEVERVIFQLQNAESLRTNGNVGSQVNLRLDSREPNTCFMTVDSDDEEWMNSTFTSIKEQLNQHRNRHGLFRNPAVDLLVQIFGLLIGFFVSLWGASLISKQLTIENSFLISFLLVLILFSNLWTPIKLQLQLLLIRSFPSVKFLRPNKDTMHWLLQTLVGGIVVAFTLFLLNVIFSWVGALLGAFVQGGT